MENNVILIKDKKNMKKVTDEMIMAYVDGELGEKERRQVERALELDPELRKKLHLFQESSKMLRGVYDAPLEEEVPERFRKVIFQDEEKSQGYGFIHNIRDFFKKITLRPVPIFLTCILLVACVVTIFLFINKPANNTYLQLDVIIKDEIQNILETIPSGHKFTIKTHHITIVPILSFKDKQGKYCRQFLILTTNQKRSIYITAKGLACRNQKGKWQIIAYEIIDKSRKNILKKNSNTSYQLAEGKDKVDILIKRRISGRPLSKNQELEAIKNGWKP